MPQLGHSSMAKHLAHVVFISSMARRGGGGRGGGGGGRGGGCGREENQEQLGLWHLLCALLSPQPPCSHSNVNTLFPSPNIHHVAMVKSHLGNAQAPTFILFSLN